MIRRFLFVCFLTLFLISLISLVQNMKARRVAEADFQSLQAVIMEAGEAGTVAGTETADSGFERIIESEAPAADRQIINNIKELQAENPNVAG